MTMTTTSTFETNPAALDFAELLASRPVRRRCRAYLRNRLDARPELLAIAPGGFTRVLTQRARFPTGPEKTAMLSILAERDLDPFVRIWLMFRRGLLSSRLLRRYADRLAILAYALLEKYPVAYEAIRAMRTEALDVARVKVGQLKELYLQEHPVPGLEMVNALCAFAVAFSDVPYEAATRATGFLIDAHAGFHMREDEIMKTCSDLLRVVCARTLAGRKLKKAQADLRGKEETADENP